MPATLPVMDAGQGLPPTTSAAARATPAPPAKKEALPSPPLKIHDRSKGQAYNRIGFLGEGGFARVYEVKDSNGQSRAVKVVSKTAIRTKKSKTKLWAEIKLHQMLKHPHIVQFQDCFEDEDNVYMLLELCDHGSLMDLLRRRKRFTEPEARFFLVQLIGACQYMHNTNVIHRDLKLGNLFLDREMNIKVGDFGLAALIEKPGDRKKTICGTPNYIAPEVLFDTANGHSFEVDVWSVGVILYTLIIGKPPFQTKDVKAIYKRIRENRYEFPPGKEISNAAMDLIMSILNTDPEKRPSLDQVLAHPFFLDGAFPSYIPSSARDVPPDFNHISQSQSKRNFERACSIASIGNKLPIAPVRNVPPASLGPSIIQQEIEFKNAVQPDSPISALINSARQPLVQAPAPIKEPSLLRKLSAAGAQGTLSPVRKASARRRISGHGAASANPERMEQLQEEDDETDDIQYIGHHNKNLNANDNNNKDDHSRGYDAGVRNREIAAQKARIVSGMAGMQLGSHLQTDEEEQEVRGIGQARSGGGGGGGSKLRGEIEQTASPKKSAPLGSATTVTAPNLYTAPDGTKLSSQTSPSPTYGLNHYKNKSHPSSSSMAQQQQHEGPRSKGRMNLYETYLHNLEVAYEAAKTDIGFRTPNIDLNPPPPKVFVVSWLDYCNKYGMGFAMNDGCFSVCFNDSSSMVLSPGKTHIDYIATTSDNSQFERRNYLIDQQPKDLNNKLYLLRHFESYMLDRLVGSWDYMRTDLNVNKGMVFVSRYLRTKHVILFRLSNNVLQLNFYDHTKLILSNEGLVVSLIDKNSVLRTWSLEALLRPIDDEVISPKDKRRLEGVLHKLQYAKDVLEKIRTHGLVPPQQQQKISNPAAPSKVTEPAVISNGTIPSSHGNGHGPESKRSHYESARRPLR